MKRMRERLRKLPVDGREFTWMAPIRAGPGRLQGRSVLPGLALIRLP
jgi:hypothetical protein